MNRKLIAKSNFILRKVLNSKDNLDIIQDFIESFLKIQIEKIELNPYLQKREKYLPAEENFGIADVRLLTKEKEELNVGIQFIDGYYVQNKMLVYYAQIHSQQLEYGQNRKVAKTITINLLDFNYFNSKKYHKKIQIPSKQDENGRIEEMEFHVIELPKFWLEKGKNITREMAWMIFLCGDRNEEYETVKRDYPKIKKLDELLEHYWKEEKME